MLENVILQISEGEEKERNWDKIFAMLVNCLLSLFLVSLFLSSGFYGWPCCWHDRDQLMNKEAEVFIQRSRDI